MKGNFIILSVVVCQLLTSNCSRRVYNEPPVRKVEKQETHAPTRNMKESVSSGIEKGIDNNPEKEKLKDFMASGTGKTLNTHNVSADEIIETAQKYLGVPHCMGGTSMKCIDCSGLLVKTFGKYGIVLPHNSEEQARYGKKIGGINELRRGDLVFFVQSYKTNKYITHSGIYLGENKFIHASRNDGVTITSMSDPYWREKFVFGTRVLD